jgi:hypothetical protein
LFTDGQLINRGTNIGAITSSGHTSTRVSLNSYNPFNITNTGVDGSLYVDGTGDYVGLADSAVLDAAGDFTLECWFYPTSNPTDAGIVVMNNGGGSATAGAAIRYSNAQFGFEVSGGNINSGTSVLYQWHHLALVRNGSGSNNVKAYLQGNLIGQVSSTNTQLPPQGMVIGRYYSGVDNFYAQGYIADVRYVVGTAVYTANFSPTTSRLTAVANTQVLTCQFDQPHNNHTFLDSSSNQFLITRSGNASQGTFSPFSPAGWSVYFIDTSSHNISAVTGAETSPGTGDFCAELWYWTSKSGNQALIGNLESNTETQWVFTLITGGVIRIQGWNNTYVSGTSGPLNSWNHVAVCRSGTTMSIFVNGSRVGTATVTNNFSGTSNIRVGGPNGVDYFLGYISNARFVKGSSVYDPTQVSITVPTGPLTAITNTKFLVCQSNRLRDISSNNFTLTTSGSPQVQAFSPFAPTAVYSPAVHGGSMYLDGTGDYLEMTYNPAFKFAASQDFCVEFWAYATSSLTANYILSQVTTNNWGFIFGVGSVTSGRMGVYYGNGATNSVQYLDDTAAFPLYQWIHVAWCRTSGTMSLFVDGTRRSTVSNTNAINLTTDRGIRIGAHQDGAANQFWPGYIANLRSIVGNSPYNATLTTLTLPTAPLTSTANTSILLNFVDGAIIDRTGRNVLETVADARTSSVVTKFTGGSMYFDGTGDYATIPASELFTLRTADFTVECWIYFVNFNNQQFVGTLSTNSTTSWAFYVQGSNLIFSNWNVTAVSYSTASMTTLTWYHVATTRQSGTFRLFVNGTVVNSNTPAVQDYSSAQTLYIGDDVAHTGTGAFTGYISDLRITRGYARYTANFTAPASRFIAQ